MIVIKKETEREYIGNDNALMRLLSASVKWKILSISSVFHLYPFISLNNDLQSYFVKVGKLKDLTMQHGNCHVEPAMRQFLH